MTSRFHMFASATAVLTGASFGQEAEPRAAAQQAVPDPADEIGDEEIVVTGQRARGAALGDILPLETLDPRDVRATGATSISELLVALAPQIGSAQGRGGEGPILLLNGQRISGFRELRDVPTEAIHRVEILPEEVALKYGFAPTQKVVNIVLRRRFRSTAALAAITDATDGGQTSARADITRLMIASSGRTIFNLRTEGNGMLTEAERDISGSDSAGIDGASRSLIGTRRLVRGTATVNRKIFGDVAVTANGELSHSTGRSLLGIGDRLLRALGRDTRSDSAHAGALLNWNKANWQWSITGNSDVARNTSRSDRDDALFPRQRTRDVRASADLTATANGSLFKLPAGEISMAFRVGVATTRLVARRTSLGNSSRSRLGRSSAIAAINLDLPLLRRGRGSSVLGNLTISGDAEVSQLSDFGGLTTFGASANWSPLERFSLLASWRREHGAPSIQRLGDPLLETPSARIFDFTTGATVLITAITGGDPRLRADRRSVFKAGANWQPLKEIDLSLRGEYVRSTINHPVREIFAVTSALEAAFPDRFTRDAGGQLIAADLRPINFDQARKDTMRVGFDFSKRLKSKRPSRSTFEQLRAQFGGGRDRPPSGTEEPRASGERGNGVGRGFGGRSGGSFGGSRGRLTFSLADTITLADKVTIDPGFPALDYLRGEAAGGAGGTPRHLIEAQAGWANNGLGVRISGNFRSGTRVDSIGLGALRFSPLATLDMRLFANFGDQLDLVIRHPWLRGSSMRLEVSNVFNARPKIRDVAGLTPLNYQPDLLDPLGRTITITIRKLFSPTPATDRAERRR